MRGVYQAAYLSTFSNRILSGKRSGQDAKLNQEIDIGKAFDLIVGTSTGGIVACALAKGISMHKVLELYQKHGSRIFPLQFIRNMPGLGQIARAKRLGIKKGDTHLRMALEQTLGSETVGQMYQRRGIALAIPAVDIGRHAAIVFKTNHLARLNGRDDPRKLAEICLATSAAPILRSMAQIPEPGPEGTTAVYVDGGLWANNPALIAMTEAIEILRDRGEEDRPVHLSCLVHYRPKEGRKYRRPVYIEVPSVGGLGLKRFLQALMPKLGGMTTLPENLRRWVIRIPWLTAFRRSVHRRLSRRGWKIWTMHVKAPSTRLASKRSQTSILLGRVFTIEIATSASLHF